MPFTITESCTGCTACVKRCPTDAITGARHVLHVIEPSLCIDCGACGVVCPDEAIFDQHGQLCEKLAAAARPVAFVDLQACTGCEWCVWSCPFDALRMVASPDPSQFAPVVEVLEKKCVGCTLCELDCPYDAIHVFRKNGDQAASRLRRNTQWREGLEGAKTGARGATSR